MPPEEYHDFENFFNDKVKARGLNLERISEQTGISLKHLESLSRGHYEAMPPAPYFRGYLAKLGALLDFDPELWWARFQAMGVVKKSGPQDQLPKNRFARSSKIKFVIFGIVALAILIYFGMSLPRILGKPQLNIDYPPKEVITVHDERIWSEGSLKNGSNLTLNGEPIQVADDGTWRKEVLLDPGLNTLNFDAKKFLGREVNEIRQVNFEAILNAPANSSSTTSH
jgi:hypothetical protein